ncbi:hypothetical protein BKA70DRAFT_483727 [Coprinopsis sp. MPI-PUGE-AT-0042]|nr:hypothetical protein BKA70DRAFT_483727 [Coprinopsis sp. MPI-PUGE-AT-0042]
MSFTVAEFVNLASRDNSSSPSSKTGACCRNRMAGVRIQLEVRIVTATRLWLGNVVRVRLLQPLHRGRLPAGDSRKRRTVASLQSKSVASCSPTLSLFLCEPQSRHTLFKNLQSDTLNTFMLYHDAYDRVTMNILTSFPFTFKLTVPGLSNPFTSLATNPPSPTTSKSLPVPTKPPGRDAEPRTRSLVRPTRPLPISVAPRPSSRTTRPSIPGFHPLPNTTPSTSLSRAHGQSHLAPRSHFSASPSPSPAPVNRKRGWEPSYSPSPSETTLASTNGYLDTPARYRDLAGQHGVEVQYVHGVRDLADDGKSLLAFRPLFFFSEVTM